MILALEILFFYSADNQKSFKPSLSNQTPTLLHISACVCHAMSSLCMAPGPRPSVLLMLLIWEFAPVSATALLSSLCLLGLSPCQLCRSCCHSQVQTIIPTLHTSGIIVRIKGVIYVMKVLWKVTWTAFTWAVMMAMIITPWTIFRWLKIPTQPDSSQYVLLSPGLPHTVWEVWQFKQWKDLLVDSNVEGEECLGNELLSLRSQWEIWYPGKC